jgi:phthalate 4,5-cis-dihydrodiol dehydrogenase
MGMAGLGVASTQILPSLADLPFVKITAAADTRADALAKFAETYKGETFTGVEAMCASPNVDAVYIASTPLRGRITKNISSWKNRWRSPSRNAKR